MKCCRVWCVVEYVWWRVVDCFEVLRVSWSGSCLKFCGVLWSVVECCGVLWSVVECCKCELWSVVSVLWSVVGCCEVLWCCRVL